MCVLLFDVFKYFLLRKTDVLKTCRKGKFLGKKIWRNALALKSKRYKLHSGKRLFQHYYLQLSFVYKTLPHIYFELFCSGDEKLLSEFFRKCGDFRDIMKVSINILAKNQKFKKLRQRFLDVRALITTTLISPSHWKPLYLFAC